MNYDMEFHEAAELFPLCEETIPELAEDIKKRGLKFPIILFEGKVLDGRRRLAACRLAGVAPRFEEIDTDDPIAESWSLNGSTRRHLDKSQLSMVGARMKALRAKYDEEAKERQKQAGERGRQKQKGVMEIFPQPADDAGTARDAVGKLVGVSGRYIDHATKVLEHGVPELVEAVDEGRMGVGTAVVLCLEPEEVQREEAKAAKKSKRRKPAPSATANGEEQPDPDTDPDARKSRGKGVALAHEAIDVLKRIPRNDQLRERGFQIVRTWMRRNK